MANARRRTQRASRSRSTVTRSTGTGASAGVLDAEEARMGKKVDWQNEFVYINKDLRQLFTVTAILFVLLIVAGFFL